MARRIPINSFGHVDVETEDGEVVGLVLGIPGQVDDHLIDAGLRKLG